MDSIHTNPLVSIKKKKKKMMKNFPKIFRYCTIFKKDKYPEYKRRNNISDNHIYVIIYIYIISKEETKLF